MLVLALAVVSFGRDVRPVEATKDEVAKMTWPQTLELGVEPAAKIVGNTLTVTGHLSNRAAKPVTVAYMTVNGLTPLLVAFEGDTAPALEYPATYPAAKLMKLEVPAQTAVQLEVRIELERYAYEGAPDVKLRWSMFLGGVSKAGVTSATLPKRALDESFFFVDQVPVSRAKFESRQKSLVGKESWSCERSEEGGMTRYLARDPVTGETFEVTERTINVGVTGTWNAISKVKAF